MRPARLRVLDALRGLALLNMIVYHFVWDLIYLFDFRWDLLESTAGYWWQMVSCCAFILISGFSWSLGRRKLRNALTVLGCGAALTGITTIWLSDTPVIFGVLTMLGSCMLIFVLLDLFFSRLPVSARAASGISEHYYVVGLFLSFIVFSLTLSIGKGYIGFGKNKLLDLPKAWYGGVFATYLGFAGDDFYSVDYFPMLPWFFVYACGFFLYKIFESKNLLHYLQRSVLAPLEWLGRRSLAIYMLHQPAVYIVLSFVLSK